MYNQYDYIPNYQNPLKFFETLAGHINSFSEIHHVLSHGNIFSDLKEINHERQEITIIEPVSDITGNFVDETEIICSFEDYSKNHIRFQSYHVLYDIADYIHGKNNDIIKPYLTLQFNKLMSIKKRYEQKITEKENYPVFSESIKYLEKEFIEKYGTFIENPTPLLSTQDDKKKAIKPTNSTPIKWNLGPAVLGTFVSELWKLQHAGNPVIEATLPQLVSFVLSNFTDEKGEPFSESTIKDYIDKNKTKTKAKKLRIDISVKAS